MKSFFITFEGLEGSGKSTQLSLLAGKLKEKGYSIVATREPGGTRIGESIRQITHNRENVDLTATTESYLMAASRAQHVREIIKPALKSGKIVLSDRYIDSSLAYQGFGRGLGEKEIEKLNSLAINGLMPDITVFLDVSVDVGFKRRNNTVKVDRLDLQQRDFYQRVYLGFLKLAKKYKNRFVIIDSSKPIDKVAEKIWEIVKNRLGLKR